MWGINRRGRRDTQRNMGDEPQSLGEYCRKLWGMNRRVWGVLQKTVGNKPQRTQRYAEEYGGLDFADNISITVKHR